MATASDRVVTVFGGTGFLGRRIVRHLRLSGFCVRVGSRHPDRGHALLGPDDAQLRSVKVDIRDQRSVTDALTDAYGAVNAVSLYLEQGRGMFHSIHDGLPNRSRLKPSEPESKSSFMFRVSVPIPVRNRSISESAARANWRFGKPLLKLF